MPPLFQGLLKSQKNLHARNKIQSKNYCQHISLHLTRQESVKLNFQILFTSTKIVIFAFRRAFPELTGNLNWLISSEETSTKETVR